MLPRVTARVYHTPRLDVPYLKSPGVALISLPHVDLSGCDDYLDNFGPELGFQEYLADPDPLPPAEQLVKYAGQQCYLSFGPKRSWNKDVAKYLTNIKQSGHGSVLEHAVFVFDVWGVSRSLTHELVRHRSGWGYSQLSQRYVDGSALRFVERPEYQGEPALHHRFEDNIEAA